MSLNSLNISRLFATPDGESHFEDVRVPLRDKGDIGYLSERIRATGMILRHTDGDYNYDWHTAPERQAIIILTGGVDIEASDGETRRFMAGDLFFAEDTTGRGHRSRAVDGLPRISIFVTFGDEMPETLSPGSARG